MDSVSFSKEYDHQRAKAMGDSYCLYILGTLLALSAVTRSEQSNTSDNDKIINHIDNIRNGLMALKKSLDTAGRAIQQTAADKCLVGGGGPDYCAAMYADGIINAQESVNDRSNPGKRSADTNGLTSRDERLLDDLLRKRYILQNINDYLQQASQTLSDERKRSCNLNLGFHCQTEQYSAIADMYNFLQSAMSPGK
ncbi:hypothetical protein ScPMuIL_015810 [Solemya velum]